MLMIFAVSSMPGKLVNSMGLGKESYHVNGHFFLFFMLCFAYYKATKSIWKSVLLTIIYGIADELHQIFVPLRSVSMFDIFVDATGGALAGLILWKLQVILPTTLKNWLKN